MPIVFPVHILFRFLGSHLNHDIQESCPNIWMYHFIIQGGIKLRG